MPGLSELVKGYEEGAKLQMDKAKAVADREAEKFDQQYKLDQAKFQLKAQEDSNQREIERTLISKQAQDRLEGQAKEKERHDKALEGAQTDTIRVREELGKAGADYKKWKTVYDSYTHRLDGLILKGLMTPEEAQNLTRYLTYGQADAVVGPQQGASPPAPQQGAAPPPQGDTQNLIQSLGQSLGLGHIQGGYSVKPPLAGQETPSSANQQTPAAQNAARLLDSKVAANAAQIRERNSRIAINEELKEANKAKKEADGLLARYRAMQVQENTRQSKDIYPLKKDKLRADIAHTKKDTDRIAADIKLIGEKTEHAKMERKLKTVLEGGLEIKDIKDIRSMNDNDVANITKVRNDMTAINKRMDEVNAAIHNSKTPYAQGQVLRAEYIGLGKNLNLQTRQFEEAMARIDLSNEWLDRFHLRKQTTSTGGDVRKWKAPAQPPLAPAPVTPPGRQAQPGTLHTRPGTGGNIRARTTEELKRDLGKRLLGH